MGTPNFRRGVPPTSAPRSGGSKTATWTAKYDGSCEYCGVPITEGEDRVQWNEDRTAVVCASHKVAFSSEEPGR